MIKRNIFCFTSPQPVRPKEASNNVSTIRDVMPLTVELVVCFSLRTQCKCCSTGAYITPFPTEVICAQWDEASVSKIVCSCTSWLRTPALHHFCFTSPQPVRPKEASDSVSTIRDVMPLTVELAVRFFFALNVSAARQALTPIKLYLILIFHLALALNKHRLKMPVLANTLFGPQFTISQHFDFFSTATAAYLVICTTHNSWRSLSNSCMFICNRTMLSDKQSLV